MQITLNLIKDLGKQETKKEIRELLDFILCLERINLLSHPVRIIIEKDAQTFWNEEIKTSFL